MSRDEERRAEDERGVAGEKAARDAPRDAAHDAPHEGAETEADDWDAAGTEDPAFYLKPSDGD